jgi:hypothetical protein
MLALLALGACATPQVEAAQAAAVPDPPSVVEAGYAQQIQEAAAAQIAAEPADAIPESLTVSVIEVTESDQALSFEAMLQAPRRGARHEREYVIFGRCPVDELTACAGQIVVGARLLKHQETAAP